MIYLDLVAIAIAADIVPMTGENRILCFLGLKKINENPNHGIQALMTLSGLTHSGFHHVTGLYDCTAGKCCRKNG